MSHGNRPNQHLPTRNSSVVSPSIRIVTPEEFALTQARLDEAKALLASYQASNEMGYEAYLRLQQSVDDGERAKQVLQNAFQTPSHRTVSTSNVLPVAGANYQRVGQSQNAQRTAKIEQVTTPSVTLAALAAGSSHSRPSAATVTEGGSNIQPTFSGGRGLQQLNDSRQHQSLSGSQMIPNPLAAYSNGNQESSGSIPAQQWWYGDHQLRESGGQHVSTTLALHHGGSERNYGHPVGGSIHATYVASVPQTSTSSLHGALGQTTATNVTNTNSGRTVKNTEGPNSTLAGFQANTRSHAISSQAVDNITTSSPGITAASSYTPPQVETLQNSTSIQTVDHGTNRATDKSPPVTNDEFLKVAIEWGRKVPKAVSLPIPLSNLWFRKDEKGMVEIVPMAIPQANTPVMPSDPIRPFVYMDIAGNFQYFDKPPGGSLHYYPPKRLPPQSERRPPQSNQQTPPQFNPHTRISNMNENTQTILQTSLPRPRPPTRAAEQFSATPPPPVTPVTQRPHSSRTPMQVRKEHLARDILRSLGVPPATMNRKRQRDDESDVDALKDGSSKTHVIDGAGRDLPRTKPVDQPKFMTTGTTPTAARDGRQRNTYDLSKVNLDGKEQVPRISHPVQLLLSTGTTSNRSTPAVVPLPQATLTPVVSYALPHPSQTSASPHSTPIQNSVSCTPVASTSRITTPQLVTPTVAPPVQGPSKVPLFLPSASNSPPSSVDDDAVNGSTSLVEPFIPSILNSPISSGVDDDAVNGSKSLPGRLVEEPSESSIGSPLRKSRATGRMRPQVYVLLPPLPAHLRTRKARAPLETDDGIPSEMLQPPEDSDGIVEGSKVYGDVEREAVELSRSRLCEQPCGWQNCESVLNSTETLRKHVAKHAQDGNSSGVYCMWQHCVGMKFSDVTKLTRHLESHIRSSLLCAYRDCDERFRTAGELVKHHASNHDENSILKPFVGPSKPRLSPSPPVQPILPSYLVEARSVQQAVISQDRHASLGPWVLRNICGPIDLGSRKQGVPVPQGTGSYEYDFLASNPSRTHRFEDINSVEVSRLVHSGFIFWKPEDAPDDQICMSSDGPDVGQNFIVQADENPEFQGSEATLEELTKFSTDGGENEGRFAPSEDEKAVELMLGVLQDQ